MHNVNRQKLELSCDFSESISCAAKAFRNAERVCSLSGLRSNGCHLWASSDEFLVKIKIKANFVLYIIYFDYAPVSVCFTTAVIRLAHLPSSQLSMSFHFCESGPSNSFQHRKWAETTISAHESVSPNMNGPLLPPAEYHSFAVDMSSLAWVHICFDSASSLDSLGRFLSLLLM